MKFIKFLFIIFITLPTTIKADLNENLISELKDGGKLVFIRHAYAPGSGDPDDFNINDCNKQRNLNYAGIEQAKDIGNMSFEFALVTGYADYSPNKKDPSKDKLILKPAKVIPQHTILCGLANLAGNKKPYKMEFDKAQKESTNAAKIFYKLSKDGTTILDLQLRYKGDFKQQPQFFATLSKKFISQMHKKCEIRRRK